MVGLSTKGRYLKADLLQDILPGLDQDLLIGGKLDGHGLSQLLGDLLLAVKCFQPLEPYPLGSRVLVMSARPGRVKADIKIELPHPRSYKIKTSPEFVALKERLVEEIRAEALKVAAEA